MIDNASAASNASRPARSDSEDRAPRPERDQRVRPFKPRRKPLDYVALGAGTQVADENGRAYKVEFLGPTRAGRNGYRATASRQRSRQVIASRDFQTVIDAKVWLDTLRITGV
jgi:hypothetical protein